MLEKQCQTLAHRGPDGQGVWLSSNGNVGLGHRRLSILDLSPQASQPIASHDGSFVLSFNGEIYNHAELRQQLLSTGKYIWRTSHSDTEVLLYAFAEWGIDCLQRLRGMFAFAIWQENLQTLWLVRDRLGIKPLYYHLTDERIIFASEIKAIFDDPMVARAMNPNSLFHYLTFLASPAPETLFAGINKLPASSYLRVSLNGTPHLSRYWNPFNSTSPLEGASEEDVNRLILQELRTSVSLRKMADVPVGVFLSGGIDSTTNAYLFSEGEGKPVKTFCVGYSSRYKSYQSEFEYARKAAAFAKAEHYQQELTLQDLVAFYPSMIELQDEPIADWVCVPLYYVSKLAKQHGITVCQAGEGADELFLGYPWWLRVNRNQTLLKSLKSWIPRGNLSRYLRYLNPYFENIGHRTDMNVPIFWGGAECFSDLDKIRLLSPTFLKSLNTDTSWSVIRPLYNEFQSFCPEPNNINWMTYLETRLRLPELLLMRLDKMTMACALEGRVPFLDHKLVELSLSIPTRMKVSGRTTKPLLKRAVRGLIPDEIIDRKKQGFGIPIGDWAEEGLNRLLEQEIRRFNDHTDIFRIEVLDELLKGQNTLAVWVLGNLACWWKRWIAQENWEIGRP